MARANIRDRNILFLCQHNGCLSFMAEAIARRLLPPKTLVFSAAVKERRIDPRTVQVLHESGINVSSQEAKARDGIGDIDLIIMLGEPGEAQPTAFPHAKFTTWKIPDPCQDSQANLETFRHTRDEIDGMIAGLFLDYWRNIA